MSTHVGNTEQRNSGGLEHIPVSDSWRGSQEAVMHPSKVFMVGGYQHGRVLVYNTQINLNTV